MSDRKFPVDAHVDNGVLYFGNTPISYLEVSDLEKFPTMYQIRFETEPGETMFAMTLDIIDGYYRHSGFDTDLRDRSKYFPETYHARFSKIKYIIENYCRWMTGRKWVIVDDTPDNAN